VSDVEVEAASQGASWRSTCEGQLAAVSLARYRGKRERHGGERKGSQLVLFAYKLRARRTTLVSRCLPVFFATHFLMEITMKIL